MTLINENFEMMHTAIGFHHFPESHTSENIFKVMESILDKYSIQIDAVPHVTDSASNMVSAYTDCEWYPCFAHKLNTCIHESFEILLAEDSEVSQIWNQMIDIRSYINRTSDNSDRLVKKLPIGCITRPWSGYFKFTNAFVNSFEEIQTLAEEKSLIMPTNKNLIQMLFEFFRMTETFFKKIQAIDTPTIHFVILELFRLGNKLKKSSSDGGIPMRMIKFGDYLFESLAKKYVSSISDAHIMSVYLHPNYRRSIKNFATFGEINLNCS